MENADPVILVVEDDINDQTFIQRAFRRSGVTNRIAIVNDGEEATAYLRGLDLYSDRTLHPLPRLIITDLKMPRMSGIELLGWLQEREEFRLIPAIVLTSSSDQTDITRAFEHGARGYMIKPVGFGELEKLVHTIAEYWKASCVPAAVVPLGAGLGRR
ncbi:response regulator [Opitutus sp. ER46]|uniref:response regulator n=1 Tax=Opitutus sp. ER46 TaxID=2161864 RepID=UPI000D2FF223|nr:response regulator [Opitutus sp. ER46]PTX98419.1 two-component system response regulator [Opitutus sp. ER46]